MYINNIYIFLNGKFNFRSKINKNGILTTEKDENLKYVAPPKKKEEYANEEEYNKHVLEFETFKKHMEEFQKASSNTLNAILSPKEEDLASPKDINNCLKYASKHTDDKEFEIKGKILVSKDERAERLQIHNEAKAALCEQLSLYSFGSNLVNSYAKYVRNGNEEREYGAFFTLGCKTMDDILRVNNIIVNGTKEEKVALFKEKINAAKKVMSDLTEAKYSDREYLDYLKENFLSVYGLTELDGPKIENVCKGLGIDVDKKLLEEFKPVANSCPTFGGFINYLGTMANPYYPDITENTYRATTLLFQCGVDDYLCRKPQYSKIMSEKENKEDNLCNENGEPVNMVVEHLSGYFNSLGFDREAAITNPFQMKDRLNKYFEMHQEITTVRDNSGKLVKDNVVDTMKDGLLKGKKFLLYDEKGNFITTVSIPDFAKCPIPRYSNRPKPGLDFRNPQVAMKNLKYYINELDSVFSFDHAEYTSIKKYIKTMDKSLKRNDQTMATMCGKLRRLAVDYIESKNSSVICKKTERTYKREEFFTRLIASIDKNYPIEYENKVRQDHRRRADKEDPKLVAETLNKIKELANQPNPDLEAIDKLLDEKPKEKEEFPEVSKIEVKDLENQL